MAEMKDGCVKPVRGPIMPAAQSTTPNGAKPQSPEDNKMLARVGAEAPDFEVTAFIKDKGFQPVKLSDYKGKWIVLCFYPGDFTFV